MVITFINQKGGSGKTTSAINLAAYLAFLGKEILLVDLDPQGNATSGLGGDPRATKTLYNVLIEGQTPSQVIYRTKIKGLNIIPGSNNLAGASIELVNKEKREYFLMNLLKDPGLAHYEYIFIDCPPSLGILTLNGLVASDQVLIPVQCEYFALEGLSQLLNTVELVKKGLKPELSILGAFLTMHDRRNSLSWEVAKEVQRNFKHFVFETVIPRNVSLAEAPSFGQSVLEYDKYSPGARAYHSLAKEFLDVMAKRRS